MATGGKSTSKKSLILPRRSCDFAAAILQAYEVTSGRALQQAVTNIFGRLARETIRTVYKELPSSQQSLLRRLLGG
jgi:hypothetical protein